MKRTLFLLGGLTLLAIVFGVGYTLGGRSSVAPAGLAQGGLSTPAAMIGNGQDADRSQHGSRELQSLISGEPASVASALRASNVPPKITQAILQVLVSEKFNQRRAQLVETDKNTPYWKAGGRGIPAETLVEFRRIVTDEQQLLKQLMGADYSVDSNLLLYQKRMYGDLAPEKLEAIQRIVSDYGDLTSQLFDKTGGAYLSTDRDRSAFLEREKYRDLSAALTQTELEEVELRISPTAAKLRTQLKAFDPSEAEFRSIYAAQAEFDRKHPATLLGLADESEQTNRRNAEKELQEAIRQKLGAARASEYERALAPSFQAGLRLAEELKLQNPSQAAEQVYMLERKMQKALSDLNSNRSLSPESRNAALAQLSTDSTSQLNALFGAEGRVQYARSSGGGWLRSLSPVRTGSGRPPGR